MTAAPWYYVDNAGLRVGPVTAEDLREALVQQRASLSGLAWREGLSEWTPISQLGAELDLSGIVPSLPPSPHVNNEVVPAGFWRRYAALVIDGLVLGIPLFVVSFVLAFALIGSSAIDADSPLLNAIYYGLYFVVAALYYAGMESSAGQATLGKRALGIKVTDRDGHRLSFAHALGRWFAAALSYLSLFVGFLMAAFTERKRALHDMVAGTLVVDKWAYTPFPERQQRHLSGCLVAFLVAMLLCLVVVPILAAIAISQYQDYSIRSQVAEGSELANGVKAAMTEYYSNHQRWPDSNASAGLAAPEQLHGLYVSAVDVGRSPGRIEVRCGSQAPRAANKAINGKHLLFSGDGGEGSVIWHCSSDDLPRKWCPVGCACER